MKKVLLLCTSVALSICAMAQNHQSYPKNFRKANVPSYMNRGDVKVPMRRDQIVDNGESSVNNQPEVPLRQTQSMLSSTPDTTEIVGQTKYDLQTNNSISNRLVWNADGTISAAWTYSYDANNSASPPYPTRGTGYNYYDGTSWLFAFPNLPQARTEASRTGFTNIVVTPMGREMSIAHQAVTGSTFNRLAVNWRATKGTGTWSLSWPWGTTGGFATWAKAVGAITNENVYVIWHGSGAPATTTSPANIVNGQNGPLVFGRSYDGGQTWEPSKFIDEIDSNYYCGFGGDSYSIDAHGDTVAISVGDTYTDVVLLKSYDRGDTWTKTIVWKHPIPFYGCVDHTTKYMYADTINDTIHSNAGDSKVILDNQGMAHVVWSQFNYHDADSSDDFYNPHVGTDNLLYWNESMGPDTTTVWDTITYGHGTYVAIAAAEDFNGNGQIDVPADTFTTCTVTNPWGNYQTGITGMPSLGIDEIGNVYISYQTINELADTATWHMAHRHIYVISIPYDMQSQTYDLTRITHPYNIIPSIAEGGDGENEECVFGAMARRVDWATKTAYILYQEDQVPGHSLATVGTCEQVKNLNVQNALRIRNLNLGHLGIGVDELTANDVKVSQNYPNPAGDATNISVSMIKGADLKIEVANILGKVVYTESKGKVAPGVHTLTINTSSLAQGVYTYTVTTGDIKTTRKMIVE